ncbi:Phosphoglucosamine mutase [Dirofilaria immitis]
MRRIFHRRVEEIIKFDDHDRTSYLWRWTIISDVFIRWNESIYNRRIGSAKHIDDKFPIISQLQTVLKETFKTDISQFVD